MQVDLNLNHIKTKFNVLNWSKYYRSLCEEIIVTSTLLIKVVCPLFDLPIKTENKMKSINIKLKQKTFEFCKNLV